WASGRAAGESWRADQRLDNFLQFFSLLGIEAGRKSDVIEQAFIVVESQQQRSDPATLLRVAEASNYTVRSSDALHLHHGSTLTGCIGRVEALSDNSVETNDTKLAHPLLGLLKIG